MSFYSPAPSEGAPTPQGIDYDGGMDMNDEQQQQDQGRLMQGPSQS